MDVGNPSNFERMSWLYGGDVDAMRRDIAGCRFTRRRGARDDPAGLREARLPARSRTARSRTWGWSGGQVGQVGQVGQAGQVGRLPGHRASGEVRRDRRADHRPDGREAGAAGRGAGASRGTSSGSTRRSMRSRRCWSMPEGPPARIDVPSRTGARIVARRTLLSGSRRFRPNRPATTPPRASARDYVRDLYRYELPARSATRMMLRGELSRSATYSRDASIAELRRTYPSARSCASR